MKPIFGEALPRSGRVNPCLAAHGPGPEGAVCKTCRHFYRVHLGNTYLKCDLRQHTNGPGSDHRANWPACGRYEAGQQREVFGT